MPTRLIREGWIDSLAIDQLDANAERFFLRLCLKADDFGRFHAHPVLLKSNLFPLRETVRSTDMTRDLAACEKAGLVRSYEANGARYLVIEKFNQRSRAATSKFPPPPDAGQMPVIRPADDGPPRTYADSETNAKSKAKAASAPPAASPLVLPFSSDEFRTAWQLFEKHRRELRKPLTPAAIQASLRKLAGMGERRAIRCIEHSVANGWQGLFEPEAGSAGPVSSAPTQPIREPIGWKNYLNHTYPDAVYAAGGSSEAHRWEDLPRDYQLKFANEIRRAS